MCPKPFDCRPTDLAMMNFNPDDPLGDLLSSADDDANSEASGDSFAKILKQKPLPTAAAKVSSLFGIGGADAAKPTPAPAPAVPSTSASAGRRETPPATRPATAATSKAPTPQRTATPPARKEISFAATDDDDDLFADLGFDPKRPKQATKPPPTGGSGFLDDLLGPPPQAPKSAATVATASRPGTANVGAAPPKTPPSQTLSRPATSAMGRPKPVTPGPRPRPAEPLRDPLGLFSSPGAEAAAAAAAIPEPAARLSRKSSTVDWLGLGDSSSNTPQPAAAETLEIPHPPAPPAQLPTSGATLFAQQTAHTLATTAAQSSATAHQLQQHEAHLLVAAQQRSQEAALLEMRDRQRRMLHQQEQQFASLLGQQLERQRSLELEIAGQQERISAHINALMQQPALPVAPAANRKPDGGDPAAAADIAALATEPDGFTLVELRVDIRRLEMENLRLSDWCEHSGGNHDRELQLMADTHRRQVELLEAGSVAAERRLRAEIAAMEVHCAGKLERSEAERSAEVAALQFQLAAASTEAAQQLGDLKRRHAAELAELRSAHAATVDTLRQARQMELAALQESSSYLATMRQASGRLEAAGEDLQQLRADGERQATLAADEREAQLVAREQRVQQQLEDYGRQREAIEKERVAMVGLVRSLETRLQAAEQKADEEQWELRQQRARLDAERAAFERERRTAAERAEREEARGKEAREALAEERQRMVEAVAEERATLGAERAKLETWARLQRTPYGAEEGGGGGGGGGQLGQMQMSRAEVEAAVQVAQEAGRQCDAEHQRLLVAQRQCADIRRDLLAKEAAARDRAATLEAAIREAEAREQAATAKRAACDKLERRMAERARHLQQSGAELVAREARMAQERLDVSRERLELQGVRRRLYQSRCSLCKIGERSEQLGEMLTRGGGLAAGAGGGAEFGQGVGVGGKVEAEEEDWRLALDEGGGVGGGGLDGQMDREVSEQLEKMKRFEGLGAGMVGGSSGLDEGFQFLDAELLMTRIDAMGADFE